jgi:hypothetical protein
MRLLVVLLTLLAALPAHALTLLTHGKLAVLRDRPGTTRDSALIRFGASRAFASLVNPTCGKDNPASLELSAYKDNVLVTILDTPLACEKWRALRRGGYVFEDEAGAVRKISYARNKLVVQLRGPGYTPLAGPFGYVQAWLTLGSQRLLGRFHNFRHNTATLVVTRKPTFNAAEGELAFWDVLWGDDASANRQAVALHCLQLGARQDRKDGRSRFLLGMMHLYRFGQMTSDYRTASAVAKAEIDAANAAFDAALPLLWNGTTGDSRVPGFAAAARYVQGVVRGDAAVIAQGLAELDASVAANPLFNLFDFVGVVAPVIRPTDPLYAKVIEIVDFALNADNRDCLTEQPEICANDGMAPHNLEGALILFGDLYGKGLIPDDPSALRGADNLYRLGSLFAEANGWNPTFRALAADRVATVAQRDALYRNADPADDPLLIGFGPGEACATCHRKN